MGAPSATAAMVSSASASTIENSSQKKKVNEMNLRMDRISARIRSEGNSDLTFPPSRLISPLFTLSLDLILRLIPPYEQLWAYLTCSCL
jgi:hypothetical protein